MKPYIAHGHFSSPLDRQKPPLKILHFVACCRHVQFSLHPTNVVSKTDFLIKHLQALREK